MKLTLDEYLERIAWHSDILKNEGPWYEQVVKHWITEVAPHKTVEYGIECWQRLGSKGLVVDINACYYRWNRQRQMEWTGTALTNALVDLYGYTCMYSVCLQAERNLPPMVWLPSASFEANDPWQLNEWLIEHIWEQSHPNIRALSASRIVATHLAKQAWEAYH